MGHKIIIIPYTFKPGGLRKNDARGQGIGVQINPNTQGKPIIHQPDKTTTVAVVKKLEERGKHGQLEIKASNHENEGYLTIEIGWMRNQALR